MRQLVALTLVCGGVAASAACSTATLIAQDTPDGGDADTDGSAPVFPEGGVDSSSGRGCSGDLHNVVDSNGVVLQTCPPDQGCQGGVCVPACQAAGASKGSIGCDYLVTTPSFFLNDPEPCFAMFIANNWPSDAVITVERAGTTYDVTKFGRIANAGTPETTWAPVPSTGIPVGQVAVLFLSSDPNGYNGLICPVTPAIYQAGGSTVTPSGIYDATGKGHAWHVSSSRPVTSYDIHPYGGATSYLPSAELLYPTTAWGTNFFGIVPPVGNEPSTGMQWGQIAALEDSTTVTILPNVALPSGGGVGAAPANVATKFTLNAGEYIQWQPTGEMSGTVIQSDKPASFWGGNTFLHDSSCCGESAHQETMPITAYGSEYAIAPYTTRKPDLSDETIPYRIVGAVKGTTLTFSPPIAGAPPTIDNGQVVDFTTTGAFTVVSQDVMHPFYIAQLMTGAGTVTPSRPGCAEPPPSFITPQTPQQLGDQEFVNELPPAQFLSSYVFFTDATYATTNLVFTRVKTAAGFEDVSLDCAGTLTGWKPVGTGGKYEFTNVDLIRAGMKNGTCNNGPHTASSKGPFGVMVWGIDWAASYAYPAGGNAAGINTVVVQPVPN